MSSGCLPRETTDMVAVGAPPAERPLRAPMPRSRPIVAVRGTQRLASGPALPGFCLFTLRTPPSVLVNHVRESGALSPPPRAIRLRPYVDLSSESIMSAKIGHIMDRPWLKGVGESYSINRLN